MNHWRTGAVTFTTVLGLIATPILLVTGFSPPAFAPLVDRLSSLYTLFGYWSSLHRADVALASRGTGAGIDRGPTSAGEARLHIIGLGAVSSSTRLCQVIQHKRVQKWQCWVA